MAKKPEVAIIIRTYNSENTIKKCLENVFNQKTHFPYEVIIVDSGSIDKTLSIITEYPAKIVTINKQEFTFGRSLNIGCEASNARYCVSLSSDAHPADESWLQNLITPLADDKIAGVYGKELPREDCNPLEARRKYDAYKDDPKHQTEDCFFANSNSAFKRELWKENRFEETLTSTEDHLWAKQMLEKGYAIYYEPKAAVFHSHNYSLRALFKRTYRNTLNKMIKIEKKSSPDTFLLGAFKIFRSPFVDCKFIITNKYNPLWILWIIPYNITIGLAFFGSVVKNKFDKLFKKK